MLDKKRADCLVTKIYSHFNFDQERFKRDFILMNQRSSQNAKKSVEKDVFKLLKNTNFGYDCRDNCTFKHICDEISETSSIKSFYNLLDKNILSFFKSDLIAKEIEKTFNKKILKIKDDNRFRDVQLTSLQYQMLNV